MNRSIEFSHRELTLALFALQGDQPAGPADGPCSPEDDACPIVENIGDLFEHTLADDRRLSRHLDKHLRQSWIECGLLNLMEGYDRGGGAGQTPPEKAAEMQAMHERLREWKCKIQLEDTDRLELYRALSGLPRSAWITMPRTLWQLKRKLKPVKKEP